MFKKICSVFLAVFLLFALISCSKSEATDSAYLENFDYNGDYGIEVYNEAEMPSASSYSDNYKESKTNNDLDSRKIIKNAYLAFQTTEFDEFMSKLNESINSYYAYIESSNIYSGGITSKLYSRSADITVRVPSDNYDSFINLVGNIGSLTTKSETSDDITLTYVDVESKISALETEYEALLELLENSETLDNIIAVRNRISDVQYELESYKSRLRKYDDLVSYCTVNISVNEVKFETVSEDKQTFGERISAGLNNTFSNLSDSLQSFSVWFIVNLPYIIIWAVIILIVILIIKAIVKSSKKKKEKRAAEKYLATITNNNEKTESETK